MPGHDRNWHSVTDHRSGPGAHAGGGIATGVLISVMIVVAAVLTRSGLMSAPPEFDELYHYLAALGWLETGELRILDGSYTRAAAYTLTVARFLDLTAQDSLAAARVVSLLPGLALPLALFWWLRGRAGGLVAGIATGFAVLWPQGILESQMLRFYSLHVLLFFAGAVAVYAVASGQGRTRWGWAIAALVLLGAATLLQVTTVVACGGLAIWLAGRALVTVNPGRRWAWGLGGAVLILAALALLWPTGALEKAWALYRFSPGNAVATRDYAAFYHNGLRKVYETFWPLFPVAVLLALRVNARLTWFCVAIFGTVFVVQSFGAMKADRYISGAMPFFFAVWGLAGAEILQMARRRLPVSQVMTASILVGCIGFMLASNGFLVSSVKLAAGGGYDTKFRPDFSGLTELLKPWRDVPFLATTNELHMVAELGDYDVDLRRSAGWEAEFDPAALFGRDPRTGRYALRGEEGMVRLLACVRAGVLVSVDEIWKGNRIGGAFRSAAAAQGIALQVRSAGALVAVRWDEADPSTPQCDGVPEF